MFWVKNEKDKDIERDPLDDVIKITCVPNSLYGQRQGLMTSSHHQNCVKCSAYLEDRKVKDYFLMNHNNVLYAFCRECVETTPIYTLLDGGIKYYADMRERLKPFMEKLNKSVYQYKNW